MELAWLLWYYWEFLWGLLRQSKSRQLWKPRTARRVYRNLVKTKGNSVKFFLETTDYGDKIANGVYLLDDAKEKMYAYVSPSDDVVKTFNHPIRISTKGRKFKVVANTYNYVIPGEIAEQPRWEVMGSKGDTYYVTKTENGLVCTCGGFKFRGECKHGKQIEMGTIPSQTRSVAASQSRPLVERAGQISRKRTF